MERYLGAKIKELRQSRNWTQAYLAERLNKSVSTGSGYESDAHPVPTDVLISIAELFGISLDALLGLEKPTGVSTQGLSASGIPFSHKQGKQSRRIQNEHSSRYS